MAVERILIVDDEETLCEVLKLNLENEGYDVDIAFSAEQALMLDLKNYSLILLDIMMGEISGIKMAKILKANVTTADIPIIFCTARDTEDDMVMGLNIGVSQKYAFDLRREYVYATDNQHIIASTRDFVQLNRRSSARTRIVVQAGNISGSITKQRHTFFRQGGDNQLATFADGKGFQGIHVHDFGIEMVVLEVHTRLILTFTSNARACDFTQTIDVHSTDAKTAFDIFTHPFRPSFRTKYTALQLDVRADF